LGPVKTSPRRLGRSPGIQVGPAQLQQPITGRRLLFGVVGSFRGKIGARRFDRREEHGTVGGIGFDGEA
jgi:hypothetical protein